MLEEEQVATVFYLDVNRDEESWRPLLGEAEKRLHNKVQTMATVKSSAFREQIQHLCPWRMHLVQIVRAPKVRRLPLNLLLQQPVSHRAAILRLADGQIQIETEAVDKISKNPGAKFESPVAYGIFIYGEAPSTTYNPDSRSSPRSSALYP